MGSDASPTERFARDDSDVVRVLTDGRLDIEGRLVAASNASFYGAVTLDDDSVPCIYKPVAGERPLWDFPEGNLANRELAARVVSEAAGWGLVPPTVLRDGRFGPGMVQLWIEESAEHALVDVVPADEGQADWIAVLAAEDAQGLAVLLVHADDPRLRDMAVFDVVINNADRKGGHVLLAPAEAPIGAAESARRTGFHLWGCDHGVSFHVENKLRTVLWGWADDPLREQDLAALHRLTVGLDGELGEQLSALVTPAEVDAVAARVAGLTAAGRMPVPDGSWPAIPWPAF